MTKEVGARPILPAAAGLLGGLARGVVRDVLRRVEALLPRFLLDLVAGRPRLALPRVLRGLARRVVGDLRRLVLALRGGLVLRVVSARAATRGGAEREGAQEEECLLYTSPSPRD